ncbi:MAG: hypothetical protein ACFCBV_13125 [Phycisphaerales bacterium]
MADGTPSKLGWKSSVLRMAMVVALSIAIWAFAEARSLATETRTATIVLGAPAGLDMTAWVAGDNVPRTTVTMRLEGSRAALTQASQRLREPVLLQIGASLPTEVGPATVNLREALRDHRVFDRLAVSLVDVTPPTIAVVVDNVVREEIPVRVRTGGAPLEGLPIVEPATVSVVGPATIVQGVAFDTLQAPVSTEALDQLESGSTTRFPGLTVNIPSPWRTELVQISPLNVDATVTLRDTIESHVIPRVPVMVRLSTTQITRWTVNVAPEDAYLRDVEVRGPSELVQAVAEGRQRVVATLELEGIDLLPGEQTFEAVVSAGVEGLTFVVADSSVPVEVIQVVQAGGGETDGLDPGD